MSKLCRRPFIWHLLWFLPPVLSFPPLPQTGAAGHADSLSPFFCRRGNCHPLSFSPLNTVWRMYACVCARVLGRRWQCGARRKTGFISSAINRWMHVHSHTFGLLWMTKAGSFTTSTRRERASREGGLRPERLLMQQWERTGGVEIVLRWARALM